jgi:hypothetical protein
MTEKYADIQRQHCIRASQTCTLTFNCDQMLLLGGCLTGAASDEEVAAAAGFLVDRAQAESMPATMSALANMKFVVSESTMT